MADILFFDTIDSTNTYLKKLASEGSKEGTAVIAKSQTKGRGRMGRSFYSPENTGLYMSILLKPSASSDITLLTPMAAVAVAEAIEEISGTETSVKWVNDIYIQNKKVCGILTEGSVSKDNSYAIIGIGINISEPEGGFPEEIENIAGAVFKKAPEGAFEKLYNKIIENIFKYYKEEDFIPKYRKRCDFLNGKEVTVSDGKSYYTARVTGIDEKCRLTVITSSGEEKALYSGEANILKQPL